MRTAKVLQKASPLVLLVGGVLAVDSYHESAILAMMWFVLGLVGTLITRVIANVGQIVFEQRGELIQALQNTERSLFQIGACNKEIRDMVNESVRQERAQETRAS